MTAPILINEQSEMTAEETDADHFICCEAPEDGSPVQTLCGLISQFDGFTNTVGCVVCADLERNDWCPEHGRCLWSSK